MSITTLLLPDFRLPNCVREGTARAGWGHEIVDSISFRLNLLIQVRFSNSVDLEIRLPSFAPSCDLMLAKTVSGMDWFTVMDRLLFIYFWTRRKWEDMV